MIRYLTWRNIFGVFLLAILVMIWPLELLGWYSLQMTGATLIRINALTGHVTGMTKEHPGEWRRVGW
jgi:uncharacterized ion transporter superfamily protein YfcC